MNKQVDKTMNFIYCDTIETYKKECTRLKNYEDLACDTETYIKREYLEKGLGDARDPHTASISLLTLYERNGTPVIFDILVLERLGYDPETLIELLKTRKSILYANAKFDVKHIYSHFGVMLRNSNCVRVYAKLIHNATGSKFGRALGAGLADLCRDYLNVNITGKGVEQIQDWYVRPTAKEENDQYVDNYWLKKLEYAAADVKYLFQLKDMMLPTIINPLPKTVLISEGGSKPPYGLGMKETLELEEKFIAVAARMEYKGLPVDTTILEAIDRGIYDSLSETGVLLEASSYLVKEFNLGYNPSLWSDYLIPHPESFKALNNPVKLKTLINTRIGTSLTNVQASVVERMIDVIDMLSTYNNSSEEQVHGNFEFINETEEELFRELLTLDNSELMTSCKLAKVLVTYKRFEKLRGMNLLKYVAVDGRIHPSYDQLGAATGRTSSSNPNGQNISGRLKVTIERLIYRIFGQETVWK